MATKTSSGKRTVLANATGLGRPTLEDARSAGRDFLLRPADQGARDLWREGAHAWVDRQIPHAAEGESDRAFGARTDAMYDAFMDGVSDAARALRSVAQTASDSPPVADLAHVRDELQLALDVYQRAHALFQALHLAMSSSDEPCFDHKLLADIGVELMGIHVRRARELCDALQRRG